MGVSGAPESLDFINLGKGSGSINVGFTTMGQPYRLPTPTVADYYYNMLKYQGGQ